MFVLPEFQDKGIARTAIKLCEELHGSHHWKLDTIMQEPKNCHLYEKMGYRLTGTAKVINKRLTLVFLKKSIIRTKPLKRFIDLRYKPRKRK